MGTGLKGSDKYNVSSQGYRTEQLKFIVFIAGASPPQTWSFHTSGSSQPKQEVQNQGSVGPMFVTGDLSPTPSPVSGMSCCLSWASSLSPSLQQGFQMALTPLWLTQKVLVSTLCKAWD